jgi:hypothetical protein
MVPVRVQASRRTQRLNLTLQVFCDFLESRFDLPAISVKLGSGWLFFLWSPS